MPYDSLPIPTRDEIQNSPITAGSGAASGFRAPGERPSSPVSEDPSAELEKELAGTHLGARR